MNILKIERVFGLVDPLEIFEVWEILNESCVNISAVTVEHKSGLNE